MARLHFHPDCRLGDPDAQTCTVDFPGGRARLDWSGWQTVVHEESFYCPRFGVVERNPCLAFATVAASARGDVASLSYLMRILFFSHYFPPESNAPAARTHAHCTRWAAAGHDVTVVTCVPHHPRGVAYPGYRNRLRQVERMDGVRVVRVGTYLAANEGLWKRTASWLSYLVTATLASMVESRPDVVIATSPHLFCGWAGVLASRWHRRPLLLEIRDLWPEFL